MKNYDKTLGCLIGAAAGDAMGASTELRTTEQILEYFGGYVTSFKKPPDDTFGRCNEAGMCTDDFLQGFYLLEEILADKGTVSKDTVKRAFKRWLEYPFYINFTGPTTRAAMEAIFNDSRQSLQGSLESKEAPIKIINNGNSQGTNGGAMKIYPIGLLNAGNIEKAIREAIEVTRFTHNNTLAISGACAVAAGVAHALTEGATVASVIEATIEGAEKGYHQAKASGAEAIAGAKVTPRIRLAVSIAQKYPSWKEANLELADIIGNGLLASEAVPLGVALFSFGNPLDGIFGGVNIGNDTDTIATIAGALGGALKGEGSFPKDYLTILNRKNSFDLALTAKKIVSL